ncbi:hypothetical protein HQ571_03100 [Candidatus Kuenenbacteria bacterium]|nr:hypothetical protein [Candidatus Kuenenbacteria bacterium]
MKAVVGFSELCVELTRSQAEIFLFKQKPKAYTLGPEQIQAVPPKFFGQTNAKALNLLNCPHKLS